MSHRHAMLLFRVRRRRAVAAAREDALVVGEAVARQGRQPLWIAIAWRMRRFFHLARFAVLVRGQVAFQIDHFAHGRTIENVEMWHAGRRTSLAQRWLPEASVRAADAPMLGHRYVFRCRDRSLA